MRKPDDITVIITLIFWICVNIAVHNVYIVYDDAAVTVRNISEDKDLRIYRIASDREDIIIGEEAYGEEWSYADRVLLNQGAQQDNGEPAEVTFYLKHPAKVIVGFVKTEDGAMAEVLVNEQVVTQYDTSGEIFLTVEYEYHCDGKVSVFRFVVISTLLLIASYCMAVWFITCIKKDKRFVTSLVFAVMASAVVWGMMSWCGEFPNEAETCIGLFAICVVLSMIIIMIPDKIRKVILNVVFAMAPAVISILFEYFMGINIFTFGKKVVLANFAVMYGIYFLIWAICQRKKMTIYITGALIYVLATANFMLTCARDRCIVPSDFLVIKEAMSVAGGYSYVPDCNVIMAVMAAVIMVAIMLLLREEKRKIGRKKRMLRFGIGIIPAICIVFSYYCLDYKAVLNTSVYWWDLQTVYDSNGYLPGFLMILQEQHKNLKPEGYSDEKVIEILSGYEGKEAAEDDVNVIVIMNEALTDYSLVSEVEPSKDYLQFIHSLDENTVKGKMYVSIIAGNTVNTEYEFLTGNSLQFFRQGDIPFVQYVSGAIPSVVTTFNDMGYRTIGMHPYYATGYNRNNVYNYMGFGETYFMEDFENPEYVRYYISDLTVYNKIIDIYKNKEDENLFVFAVTMQNHGGYLNAYKWRQKVTMEPYEGACPKAEEYLSSVNVSDKAFKNLITYFEKQDEKVVIVMFGDHQPGLDDTFNDYAFDGWFKTETEYQQLKYVVPFILWANYDIEEEEDVVISGNFVSSYLLDKIGLATTPYNEFILHVYDKIKAMNHIAYQDEYGQWHDYEEDNEYSELLEQYSMIQYNNVFGKSNRLWQYYRLNY